MHSYMNPGLNDAAPLVDGRAALEWTVARYFLAGGSVLGSVFLDLVSAGALGAADKTSARKETN